MGKADLKHIKKAVGEILSESLSGGTESYILGGACRREIVENALALKVLFHHKGKGFRTVCLATNDRGFFMSALLSSIYSGPALVIPHVLTESVVKDACCSMETNIVLSDKHVAVPQNFLNIAPDDFISGNGYENHAADPDKPFLWLYSGGTTGKPILWPKSPVNLFGEAVFLREYFGISREDIILATVPPNHIYGLLFSVLLPYVSGASVINATPYYPQEIISIALDAGATVLVGLPMHYKALASRKVHLSKMRLAFSSGGFLDKTHSLAFSTNTGIPVEEVYGSTETGGIACRSRFRDEEAFRPFPTVGWKIENERLQVRSPFMSSGLMLDEEGYYTTGDRAVPDGESFIMYGRVDNVVKVGGNRIELEALEQKIKSMDSVDDAYVFQVESASGRENEIVVLVVANRGIRDLKASLRKMLSPVEMPRQVIKVNEIPATPAGKRDRQAAIRLYRSSCRIQ